MASSAVAGTAPAGPSPWPLRAYHAHILAFGPVAQWREELERVRALGFDTLILAGLFEPRRDPTHSLVADPEHPTLAARTGQADDLYTLGDLALLARASGLALMLDVRLDRAAEGGALARQHGTALLDPSLGIDPRAGAADRAGLALRWCESEHATGFEAWWVETLVAWAAAGIAGVVWHEPRRVPAASIGRIVAAVQTAVPGTRFVAVAAGHTAAEVRALEGQGFSAIVSSFAWWDYRASWFCEECERLCRVAPVLHGLDTLLARAHGSGDGPSDPALSYRRALRSATGLGAGLVVPMGFEYGVPATLDAHPLGHSDWLAARAAAAFDLSAEIVEANRWLGAEWADAADAACTLLPLTGPEAAVTAVARCGPAGRSCVVAINPGALPACIETARLLEGLPVPASRLARSDGAAPEAYLGAKPIRLGASEAAWFRPVSAAPIRPWPVAADESFAHRLAQALKAPRIVVADVTPACEGGRYAVRRVVGEAVTVEADVLVDGHEALAVALRWRPCDANAWFEETMVALPNDRWRGRFVPDRLGRHEFVIEAWIDLFGTWLSDTGKKRAAGQTLQLEAAEGRRLIESAQARVPQPVLESLLARLAQLPDSAWSEQLDLMVDASVHAAMRRADAPAFLVRSNATFPLEAERRAAQFAAWYELFPRSLAPVAERHGTLRDVIARLPAIRAMGFTVLYFPPLHPIGETHRKGRNNALAAAPGDPGSPYAIGAAAGGHDALHPELGTFEDFAALRKAAAREGLELALDFAVQCSPDHPWLKDHPEWFQFRADGSLRYAENPPKKYEDIVNVDFYTTRATPAEPRPAARLWQTLLEVVLFWIGQGVAIFRVDNPHTKPLPFWEWLIGEVRGRHPEVIFLAEAFTRPKMMARLAAIGFSQSYTYFTWRNTKAELTQYLTELTTTGLADVFRPHFFVNTPDINPFYLQQSGRAGFVIRAALAAFLSGLWGMYSGFEICEADPLPGREEYLDSEKYQLRRRDFEAPGNIVAEITALNRIRRANPALHSHLGLTFYPFFNDHVLYFGKATVTRDNVILCAISLDPHQPQEGDFEIPLWEFGLDDLGSLHAEDLVDGHAFTWTGKRQHLRLDPARLPFAVWRIWR